MVLNHLPKTEPLVLYSSNQTFSYSTADIAMNIKPMVQSWVSGSIPNDGLILRYSAQAENDTKDYGIVKLFSKETNTIHQPKIRIGWDDQTFETGSLSSVSAESVKIGISNLKKEYGLNTQPKLRIFARDLYPVKTFTNEFAYGVTKYLPKTTYYQIRDLNSNDIIIPFGEYSKVSCDSNGNFVKLDFKNWESNRIYKIEFKIEINGYTEYFDNDITFSITN